MSGELSAKETVFIISLHFIINCVIAIEAVDSLKSQKKILASIDEKSIHVMLRQALSCPQA